MFSGSINRFAHATITFVPFYAHLVWCMLDGLQ